jgi:hypothetical protein
MKKKMIITIILIITASIFVIGLITYINPFFLSFLSNKSNEKDTYHKDLDILSQSYPSDILIYGDNIPFEEQLNVKQISEINDDLLQFDSACMFHFLIINDRNGNLTMSDDEFIFIKKKADNLGINVYYLGSQYLQKMQKHGFTNQVFEGELSVVYLLDRTGLRVSLSCLWTDVEEEYLLKNSDLLKQVLIYSFVDNGIRANN